MKVKHILEHYHGYFKIYAVNEKTDIFENSDILVATHNDEIKRKLYNAKVSIFHTAGIDELEIYLKRGQKIW